MPMQPRISRLLIAILTALLLGGCVTIVIDYSNSVTSDLETIVTDAERIAEATGPENVLVVFDIDNTLLAMEQGLGADQWYEWQKEHVEEACDERVVGDRLAVQGALFFASAMRPTQANAPALVRRLQDAGFPVIALTSRGVEFRLQTFRELRRNGYDFRRSAIGPVAGWPDDFIPDRGTRPARYEDGVFLTTGQHKGAMLKELLQRTGSLLPRAVVMVDDKQDNLDAVRETFSGLGVPVRAWRYAGEDRNVEAFDPDASHREWRQLEPALRTIQQVFGPDNFSLPAATDRSGCN